jgi:leader peptidase (prepilin peptidase) / N-methyltransferase
VNGALVAGLAVVGLVSGSALDPLGQRLAERSRVTDAQAGTVADDQPGAADGPHLVPQGRSPARTLVTGALTGGLFAGLAVHFGTDMVLVPLAVFFSVLVTVSVTDLSYRLVPRWLLYWSLFLMVPLLVIASAVDHQWGRLLSAAVGGAAAFTVFFAIWWLVPRGMGFGDVRLAGVIGMATGYLGLVHAYLGFLTGFLVGLGFGVVVMVVSASGRKTRIPFAPALAVGAVVSVFFGSPLAHGLFGGAS